MKIINPRIARYIESPKHDELITNDLSWLNLKQYFGAKRTIEHNYWIQEQPCHKWGYQSRNSYWLAAWIRKAGHTTGSKIKLQTTKKEQLKEIRQSRSWEGSAERNLQYQRLLSCIKAIYETWVDRGSIRKYQTLQGFHHFIHPSTWTWDYDMKPLVLAAFIKVEDIQ